MYYANIISSCSLAMAMCVTLKVWNWWRRRHRIMDVSKRMVVITGCDSGFGQAYCLRLDQAGVSVVAGCLLESSVLSLSTQLSGRSKAVQVDVTKHESLLELRRFVELHCQQNGLFLWGLLNNAGVLACCGPIDWLSDAAQFMPTLSVNLLGLIDSTLVFLPLLKSSKGRIVNVASISGRLSIPLSSPYNTSKFAVEGFSDCLRREMARFGVHVSIIEPSGFHTNLCESEHVKSLLVNQFNQIPPERRVGYDERSLQQLLDMNARVSRNYEDDLGAVLDAFDDALFARSPASRYVVGIDAKLFFAPVSLLPDWASDYVLRHVYTWSGFAL